MLSVLRSRSCRAPLRQAALVGRRFSSTSSSSSSSFKGAWEKYLALLETRPLATKIVTGGAIGGAGDLGCQLVLEDGKLDLKRLAIFTAMNGALVSPVLHLWYRFLGATVPGVATPAIAKRLAMDQLGFAPTFLPVFFSTLLALEGQADRIPDKLRQDWWPTTRANWTVWVPAQLLNFRFVPAPLQVLFANVVGLFWNAYLSFVSHSQIADGHAGEGEEDEDVALAKIKAV